MLNEWKIISHVNPQIKHRWIKSRGYDFLLPIYGHLTPLSLI